MGAGASVGRLGGGSGSAAAALIGDDDAMGESGCGGRLHFRMGLLFCGGAVMATAARGDDGGLTATGEARLVLWREIGETAARERNRSIGGRTLVGGAKLHVGPSLLLPKMRLVYSTNRCFFL
jgi:hypothetical protein